MQTQMQACKSAPRPNIMSIKIMQIKAFSFSANGLALNWLKCEHHQHNYKYKCDFSVILETAPNPTAYVVLSPECTWPMFG